MQYGDSKILSKNIRNAKKKETSTDSLVYSNDVVKHVIIILIT